jgi:hypothetical protein
MRRPSLILALLILVSANAVVLIEAARNRSGMPVETMELTERELGIEDMGLDNSGVVLNLFWHRQDRENYFSQEKLEALGFDFRHSQGDSHKDAAIMPRVACVALELEGKAWEQWSQRAEKDPAPVRPAYQRINQSRLFPIDVARDFSELHARHPDSSRIFITKALIRVQYLEPKDAASGNAEEGRWIGYVATLLPSLINVPSPYSRILASIPPQPVKEPRYRVTLSYGQNLEPWVDSVKRQ